MPKQSETVSLLIGGKAHSKWESYDIDSDLLTPADAWSVSLAMPTGTWPDAVVEGAPVEVRVGNDTVMSGRVDEISDEVSRDAGGGSHTLSLSGRDGAAVLLDCSAAVFTANMVSLEQIMVKIVAPLGVKKYKIDADSTLTRNKINVEPGDTAWDTLTHAAEANGLWPWFTPDGTLMVGGPDYTRPPVATLVLRRSGRGNNVKSLARTRAMQDRYSVVTVLGQTHGTATENGKNNLRGSYTDDGMTWYRPKIVTDSEADSVAVCQHRAHKLISDSRLKGFTLGQGQGAPDRRTGAAWRRLAVGAGPAHACGIRAAQYRRGVFPDGAQVYRQPPGRRGDHADAEGRRRVDAGRASAQGQASAWQECAAGYDREGVEMIAQIDKLDKRTGRVAGNRRNADLGSRSWS